MYRRDTTNTARRLLGFLNYGRIEDPAKSTYSIMAFVERGLGAKRAQAVSTVSMHFSKVMARASSKHAHVHVYAVRSRATHVAERAAHTERAAAAKAVVRTLQRLTKKMKM